VKRLVLALAVLAVLAAGCGGGGSTGTTETTGPAVAKYPQSTTMGKIQAAGQIRVGVKYDVPRFGLKNPTTGKVTGFDVDMARLVADKLGVNLKTAEANSDTRIPLLQKGKVDLVFSTMTITTDRAADINFSRPYFIAHGRILTAKDSGITGPKDLNGKKVCTATGSTYEGLLPELAPKAQLKLVDSYDTCFKLLESGQVDALVTDSVILAGFLPRDKSLAIVGPNLTTEPYGAGIKKGDTQFTSFVDGVIDQSFRDGTWKRLYRKWIGEVTHEPAQDPAKMSLQQALKFYPCEETC
jgi:glutamate transport system substrate-binding protein